MRQILGVLGGFFAGASIAGLGTAAVSIYLLERVDERFRDAPGSAFEAEGIRAVMLAFLCSLILALGAGVWRVVRSGRLLQLKRPTTFGLSAGCVFALVPWALGLVVGDATVRMPLAYCGTALYLLLYPLAVFWWALRRS